MSKHSHSFHTNSQASQSTSFFDTIQSSDFFWKKKSIKEDSDWITNPTIIENEFHIRHKRLFREWDSAKLTLKNNFLIQTKKKNPKFMEYIDLDEHMYRMEIITPTHKKFSPKYPHGFSLYANGKSIEFFCKEKTLIYDWFFHLRKYCILVNFHENYKISEVIGSGGYGKVHILESAFDENKFAGKFIKLPSLPNRDRQKVMIINEIKMLRSLDHPQIVKLFEVYEMAGQICLVMELVAGEKLFKYITGRKPLSEETSAYIVKQMLLILSYLKSQDIIHRDIKSENILYTLDDKGKIHLKLIDFGLGTYNKKRDIIKKCGTAGYVAPEILNNQPYSFKADLYSLGVIAYICLIGRPAFYARNYDELLEKNRKGIVKFKGSSWSRLSSEAQDLIQKMLHPDPFERISLSEALSHEWLYKRLSNADRLDLSEYMFKVEKVPIPQEKNISKIPFSHGQIPFVDKAQALPSQTISSYQKLGTQSFLTSKIALGIEDPKELNSFYKPGSRDGSYVSQLSLNVSHVSLSRSPSPNYGSRNLAVLPARSLTVKLPSNSPKEAPLRHQTLKCEIVRSETSKQNRGYNIQVSGAVSLDDFEMDVDDEGSLCSSRYEILLKHSFRFARITGNRQNRRRSTDDRKLRAETEQTLRLDTDAETPRMKNKVAAVNQVVRDQLQISIHELFL